MKHYQSMENKDKVLESIMQHVDEDEESPKIPNQLIPKSAKGKRLQRTSR